MDYSLYTEVGFYASSDQCIYSEEVRIAWGDK